MNEVKPQIVLQPGEVQKKYKLLLIYPYALNEKTKGALIGGFDINKFFNEHLEKDTADGFDSMVYYNNEILFSENEKGSVETNDLSFLRAMHIIQLGGYSFVLLVSPNKILVDSIVNYSMTYLILFFGVVFALSFSALLFVWQNSKAMVTSLISIKQEMQNFQTIRAMSLKAAGIGLWSWDEADRRVTLDKYSHYLLDLEPESFTGKLEDIKKRIIPSDRDLLEQRIGIFLEEKKLKLIDLFGRVLWRDGTIHDLVAKGEIFLDEEGGPLKIYGALWDISPIKNIQKLLVVSISVSRILNDAASLHEACAKIIHTFNAELGWECMAVWMFDGKNEGMKCVEFALSPSMEEQGRDDSIRTMLSSEVTLINRIYATCLSFAVGDLTRESSFQKYEAVSKRRVQSAVVFPIFQEARFVGAVELFHPLPSRGRIDEDMHNLITTVGIGIGQFLQKELTLKEYAQLSSIFRTYAEMTDDWIWEMNTQGLFTFSSGSAGRIIGYETQEIVGNSLFSLLFEDDKEAAVEDLAKCRKNKIGWVNQEMRLSRKNGSECWLRSSSKPVLDESGQLLGFRGCSRGITNSRAAEI